MGSAAATGSSATIMSVMMSDHAASTGSPSRRPSRVLMAISHADAAETITSVVGSAST